LKTKTKTHKNNLKQDQSKHCHLR